MTSVATQPTSSSLAYDAASALYNAGFRGSALVTATAIAGAESNWNFSAQNLKDPNGGSFGFMQINGVHSPNSSNNGLQNWIGKQFDPLTNALEAFSVSNSGTNFEPWSTYTSGAYKQYLAQANQAVAQVTSFGAANSIQLSQLASSSQPTTVGGILTGNNTTPAVNCIIKMPLGGGCILNSDQMDTILGGFLMGVGGIIILAGVGIILGDMAITSKVSKVVKPIAEVAGAKSVMSKSKSSTPTAAPQTQQLRVQSTLAKQQRDDELHRLKVKREADLSRAKVRVARANARKAETNEKKLRVVNPDREKVETAKDLAMDKKIEHARKNNPTEYKKLTSNKTYFNKVRNG